MKVYFLHDGKNKTGPFTFEELQQKGIESDSLIWYDGLSNWTKASEIPELGAIVLKSPPPLQKPGAIQSAIEKTKEVLDKDIVDEIGNKIPSKKGKRYFTWGIAILAVLGAVYISTIVFKSTFTGTGKDNARDSLIVLNPTGVVHPDYYDKERNYIGISGTIVNKATNWAYKDFLIEVEFYDLDKKLVETKKFTVNDDVRPQNITELESRINGEIPAGKREYTLKWKLLDATKFHPK